MSKLSWDEPRSYRRAKNLSGFDWFGAESWKFFGASILIVLGLRGVVAINPQPDRHPPGWAITLLIAVGTALLAAFLIPYAIAMAGTAVVVISPKGFNHNVFAGRGWRFYFTPWECIGEIKVVQIGSQRVLCLLDKAGAVLGSVAITESVTDDQIEAAIQKNRPANS